MDREYDIAKLPGVEAALASGVPESYMHVAKVAGEDDLWHPFGVIEDLKRQLAAALALSEDRRAWMEAHSRHMSAQCILCGPCICDLVRLTAKEDAPPGR